MPTKSPVGLDVVTGWRTALTTTRGTTGIGAPPTRVLGVAALPPRSVPGPVEGIRHAALRSSCPPGFGPGTDRADDPGWPEFLQWSPDPAALAELERLTAARITALDYPWQAVTDPAPPQVARTYEALRAGLVAAGLPALLAEWAADFASLAHHGGIVECVRWTALPKPPGSPQRSTAPLRR